MAKDREIDFESIWSMSEEQQQQAYYTLAKRANQRFRDIAKAGHTSGAVNKAQKYLKENQGRTTFKQSKRLSGIELKESLKALETFYISKSATVKGIKEIRQNVIKGYENNDVFEQETNLEKFKRLMLNSDKRKKFFDFVSSNQFKTLSKYADSNQVIEDFVEASSTQLHSIQQGDTLESISREYNVPLEQLQKLNSDYEDYSTNKQLPVNQEIVIHGEFTLDEIMAGYDEFLNSEMTFDQVNERRNSGGDLLQ